MNTLSPETLEYLNVLLAREVVDQVRAGKGDEPMPFAWTELHRLTL
jgi:hypothetical protein